MKKPTRRQNLEKELNSLFDRMVIAKNKGTKNIEETRQAMIVRLDKEILDLRKKKKFISDVWVRRDAIRKEKISFLKKIIQNRIINNLKFLVSMPFIYAVIIPAMLLHAILELYHQVCFRLYKIPRVNPKEHFIFEREHMKYLNWFEKFNCAYCSYFNCLASYVTEIGGRTERYWCPLKYASSPKNHHKYHDAFIDNADEKELRYKWDELRKFEEK